MPRSIKELRVISRLTQEDVADLLLISRPVYSYMERNNTIPQRYEQKLYNILGYRPEKVQMSGADLKNFRSGLGLTRKVFSIALSITHSNYVRLETLDTVPQKYTDIILPLLKAERDRSNNNVTIHKKYDELIIFETLDEIYIYSTKQEIKNEKLKFIVANSDKKIIFAE